MNGALCPSRRLGCLLHVGGNSICGRGLLGRHVSASSSTVNGLCCGGNCLFCGLSPIRMGVMNSSVSLRVEVCRNHRTAVGGVGVDNGSHLCRGMIHHRLHVHPKRLFDGRSLVHSLHRVRRVKRFSPRGLRPSVRPSPVGKAISVNLPLASGTGSRMRFSTN